MDTLANYIKTIIYGIFAFLSIDDGVVEILLYLMMLDSFLGVAKALRLGFGFSIKRLIWGLFSKMAMISIPMILALMAKALSFDFKGFVLVVFNIIIVNEGISCITNILSIKKKELVKNNDYITMMIEAIRKALQLLIEKLFTALNVDINKQKDGTN